MSPAWVSILIGLLTVTLTILGVVVKITLKLSASVEALKTIAARIPDLDSVVKMANGHEIRLTTVEATIKERGSGYSKILVLESDIEDLQDDVKRIENTQSRDSNDISTLKGMFELLRLKGK